MRFLPTCAFAQESKLVTLISSTASGQDAALEPFGPEVAPPVAESLLASQLASDFDDAQREHRNAVAADDTASSAMAYSLRKSLNVIRSHDVSAIDAHAKARGMTYEGKSLKLILAAQIITGIDLEHNPI